MARAQLSFEVPIRDPISNEAGMISRAWETFFRFIQQVVDPLGIEKFFNITNNQTTAADIIGLNLSSKAISQAIVEYLVQRVTTGAGAVELIESGVIHAVYKPTSNIWVIFTMGTPGPSVSGITFSINALGQVKYTSTSVTGTASISKLTFRIRTLAGKNSKYSVIGK
jgi:hypothetical protein